MPKQNEWERLYGAKRRAIDRALLAECEAAIALEEKSGVSEPKTEIPPSAAVSGLSERDRIARAFGRQVH